MPRRSLRRRVLVASVSVSVASVVAALAPATAAQAQSTSGEGVAVWSMPHASRALQRTHAHWYYTWSTRHDAVHAASAGHESTPEFVPMMWGAGSLTDEGFADVRRSRSPWLLTFNEPDRGDQANMSVEEALRLWPRLQHTHKRLVSPAVSAGGDVPGGWLDDFMRGARQRHLRVDAIAVHWYGSDFDPSRATAQLESYLRAVHRRYGKPVWLTEYALIAFGQRTPYPSGSQQAAFLRRSQAMLRRLPWVQRSAWFGLPATAHGHSTGLVRPDGDLTATGLAFRGAARSGQKM